MLFFGVATFKNKASKDASSGTNIMDVNINITFLYKKIKTNANSGNKATELKENATILVRIKLWL